VSAALAAISVALGMFVLGFGRCFLVCAARHSSGFVVADFQLD
jgi:hypothetical protein